MIGTLTAPTLPAAGRCYSYIRDGIMRRALLPGQRLVPDHLARELGVSRTPVLEALKRLALEGLVEIIPRRGTQVARLLPKDLEELADLRVMIELHAVEAALQRATPADLDRLRALVGRMRAAFDAGEALQIDLWAAMNAEMHGFIVRLAGNPRLVQFYDSLHLDTRMLLAYAGWDMAPLRQFQEDHESILQAFEARDLVTLREVLRRHITMSVRRALATLRLLGGTA